jgi:hypothetical protein
MRSKVTAGSYLHSGVIDPTLHVTAVSLIPLYMSQPYHWYRCTCHSGVIDTAVHVTAVLMISLCQVTAVSLTLLCMSHWCQWHYCSVCCWVRFPYKNSVSDYREDVGKNVSYTAVSMTPLWYAQLCHWHLCDMHSSIIDTAVTCSAVSVTPLCNQLGRLSSLIRSHIRIGFNPCIRGPGKVFWWKKTRGRKSRVRFPLNGRF